MKKKPDFKKLALLGITGGVLFASNAPAAEEPNTLKTQQLLAAGCSGGCHSTAYEPRGNAQTQYDPNQMPRTSGGCNAASQSQNYNNPAQRTSAGCNAAPQPQNYNNQSGQRISSGCGAQSKPQSNNVYNQWDQVADNGKGASNATYAQGNTDDTQLVPQLNEEGKSVFRGLSPEGKALALKLANQTCKGQNDCKGLNSCKTTENSCAGKGACKGNSPGPFKDKNQAVKIAAQKMAEKRASANSRY